MTLAYRSDPEEGDKKELRARRLEPLRSSATNEEDVRDLVDLARNSRVTRNAGKHAGGVVIAPGKLTDFCPLYQQPAAAWAPVSQFDKDDVEAIGLVKFDFLGLATLTIMEMAAKAHRARHKGQEKLRLRDASAGRRRDLPLFADGDRGGVPVRKPRHAGHAARRQARRGWRT
jgi:DNA polymerase-3 subunit alpha